MLTIGTTSPAPAATGAAGGAPRRVHVSACSLNLPKVIEEGRAYQRELGSGCTLAADQRVDRLNADLDGCEVWIFCGHAGAKLHDKRTLAFVDESGAPAVVDPSVLAAIAKQHVATLRCVLLNGCESLELGLKVCV